MQLSCNNLVFLIICIVIILFIYNKSRVSRISRISRISGISGISDDNMEGYSTKSTLRSYGYFKPFYLHRTIYHTPYEYSIYDGYPYYIRPYEYYASPRKMANYEPKMKPRIIL